MQVVLSQELAGLLFVPISAFAMELKGYYQCF